MSESISNQSISEGTASTDLLITFPFRARCIEVINDSSSVNLGYKFNASESYATLKPLEVVNPPVKSYTVYLNGTGTYRVRGYG